MRVVQIAAAQDAGRVMNPHGAEGQVEGGTAQGLGLALMEEIQLEDGIIRNASFTDYLIPTILDVPPVVTEFVEEPEPDAPYGVKGIGELRHRRGDAGGRRRAARRRRPPAEPGCRSRPTTSSASGRPPRRRAPRRFRKCPASRPCRSTSGIGLGQQELMKSE